MTNPTNGKHSPEEISDVVATLDIGYFSIEARAILEDVNGPHDDPDAKNVYYPLMCHEIHKALLEESIECLVEDVIGGYSYSYGEFCFDNVVPTNVFFAGHGDTHEEAIINALMDWASKGGNKDG